MSARCLIQFDENDQGSLILDFFRTDFSYAIEDFYRGEKNAPEISLLVTEIIEQILPSYLSGKYTLEDLKATVDNPRNAAILESAFKQLYIVRSAINLKATGLSYFENREFNIINTILAKIESKIKAGEQTAAEKAAKKVEAEQVTSLLPVIVEGERKNYVHERTYKDLRAYRLDRFKGSSSAESMLVAKFIHEAFVKNAYIDVDAKKVVNQVQTPGTPGEIDQNLKEYRKNLLKDLIARVNLHQDVNGVPTKVEFSNELLQYKAFNDTLRAIADRVISPMYKGERVSLDTPGVLFEITQEYKRTKNLQLKETIDNFIDFTILADFNKLFDYYIEGALSVSKHNDDFDTQTRKYSIENAMSVEAINASWDEKVQNGIELTAPFYKLLINHTPIVSFTTGRETGEFLYPTLVSEAFSRYFNRIDRFNVVESIREILLEVLNSDRVSRTDKNAFYTIYQKFFAKEGDNIAYDARNKDRKVRSFYNTIRDESDQSLLLLVAKPLSEISKVQYLEPIEDPSNPGRVILNNANTKLKTAVTFQVERSIADAVNKSEEDMEDFLAKYEISYNVENNTISYTSPFTRTKFTLGPGGNPNYDVNTIIELSKDLLNLDFVENPRHKEFWEEIQSLAPAGQELAPIYLTYLKETLDIAIAKNMLYNSDVQDAIRDYANKSGRERSEAGAVTSNELINKAIKEDTNFNSIYPENYNFPILGQTAKTVHDLIYNAENRYTGNRLKSTVRTVEDTTVAGFSNYNYFFGLKQNHDVARRALRSAAKSDSSEDIALFQNMFINDDKLLTDFFIRGAAKVGETVKPNSDQNDLETVLFNMNLAYFGRIKEALESDSVPEVVFDVTVYSDKTNNPLPVVSNEYISPSGRIKLFVDDSGRAVDEKNSIDLLYKSSGHYYRAYANNILDTWKKLYEQVGAEDVFDAAMEGKPRVSERLIALNAMNDKFWNELGVETFEHGLKGYEAARFYAAKAGVSLNNWVHFQHNTKSLNDNAVKLTIKPDLIKYVSQFDEDSERVSSSFQDRLQTQLLKFANELQEMDFKFDANAASVIRTLYPEASNSGDFGMENVYVTTNNRPIVSSASEIHPAVRKFFYDYNLVQENFMNSSLGPIYAHKGGDENKMWITQIKRNVAATASVRNYSLGLEKGVEDETTTAFIDDLVSYSKGILGNVEEVVDFDGASFATMTHRLKTWISLNHKFSGDGGEVHKSFISHFDPHTGQFAETKHAEFALTYEMIRQSIGTNIDLMELHKDLYRGDISKVDITKAWKDNINLSTFNDVLYFDRSIDHESGRMGTLHQLDSIRFLRTDEHGDSVYQVVTRNLSNDPKAQIKQELKIRTFFDLWQILGGIDSVEQTDNKTNLFYFEGDRKVFFTPNVKSAEKLLDFEAYIGNKGETYIPENYINGQDSSYRDAYKEMKLMFGGKGLVSSHIKLVKKYLNANVNDAAARTQAELDLKKAGVKLTGINFIATIQTFKEDLEYLFDAVIDEETADTIKFKGLTRPYQRFKGSNVDRISFAGAQKVGQYNLNNIETVRLDDRKKWFEAKGISESTEGVGNISEFTNYSGGAQGADSSWDITGAKYGMTKNMHYHAEGEKTPRGNTPLTQAQLSVADPFIKEANKTLGRQFPARSNYVNNLLRRNYYQVINSDAVFAISSITDNKVDGGTGWAVHMAINMDKPVYVFDQKQNKWFTWKSNADLFGGKAGGEFVPTEIPVLTKNFAGIGTRDINAQGEQAITDVYTKTVASLKGKPAGMPIIPGVNRLITHGISNFNAGIQLNAWHETEGATVTTPTQMLNALVFMAKKLGKVDQMYSAIGSIVDQELTYLLMNQNTNRRDEHNIPQLIRDMDKGADFYARNKDLMMRIFKDIMEQKVASDEEFTLENVILEMFNHKDFPIDDPQIFSNAIAELTNYFTKTGIRTKFDGMFAILAPGSQILQVYDVPGGKLPIKNSKGGFDLIDLKPGAVLQPEQYALWKFFNIAKEGEQPTSGPINIWAGTGENAHLSNFANRPFRPEGFPFDVESVEEAFQRMKMNYADPISRQPSEVQLFFNDITPKSAAQWKAIGNKISGLDVATWDAESSGILKSLMKQSFEQNPDALKDLLATGTAVLTHVQDRGKWGKEFPKLLMEVRGELRPQTFDTTDIKPRNLKGQQVQITYADGTTQALSMLGADETHLIPEAVALDTVKGLIGDYQKFLKSDKYSNLDFKQKERALAKEYRRFLDQFTAMLTEKDEKGVRKNLEMDYVFTEMLSDLYDCANVDEKVHVLEFLYDAFSPDKKARDARIEGLKKREDFEQVAAQVEHEYLDKLNIVGKAFLGQLQKFLDRADKGEIPASLQSKTFANAHKVQGAKISVTRAEAIAPITAKLAFKLREGDTMADITEETMYNRLVEELDYYDVDADAILISRLGKKIFVHAGAPPYGREFREHDQVIEQGGKKWFTNKSGDLLFQIPANMTLMDVNGQLHVYLHGKHLIGALRENQLFKSLNIAFGREKDKFDVRFLGDAEQRASLKAALALSELAPKAKAMYASWQVYINKLIGTRVPGQHFQSFQGMKIVGFTDSNKIHVANEVILLSGADFDIDKQNIIYHSIDEDGVMAVWHPASKVDSVENLEKSLLLPMPSDRRESYFVAERDHAGQNLDETIDEIEGIQISENLDLTDLDTLLTIYGLLDQGYKLDADKHANIIATLMNYDSKRDPETGEERIITVNAIKNFAVSSTNQIIEAPSNFLYLSNGVTTATVKQYANRAPKAKVANNTRRENPVSQAVQKGVNMVGKQGIAVVASPGLKVLSAVTFGVNKTLQEISRLNTKMIRLKASEVSTKATIALDIVNNPTITERSHPLNERLRSLSNRIAEIDFEIKYLIAAIGGTDLTLPNINYDLLSNDFEKNSVFAQLHRTSDKQLGIILPEKQLSYAKFASMFDPDLAELQSQLLSSATDNAKELDLGKINGLPSLLAIYTSAGLTSKSFGETINVMTSPLVEMLIKKATKNVYNKQTATNSITNLLSSVKLAMSERPSKAQADAIRKLEEVYHLRMDLVPSKSDTDAEGSTAMGFRDTENPDITWTAEELLLFRQDYYVPSQMSTLLSKYLSINQGIPSNSWDLYTFSTKMQDIVNTMFAQEKPPVPYKFNFKEFLDSVANNGDYHKKMILESSPLFKKKNINFNPLFILVTNPHFAKQLTAYNASNTILKESSYRVNSMYHITDKLRDVGYLDENGNLVKKDFMEIEKYVESTVIEHFIQSEMDTSKLEQHERPIFYDTEGRELRLNLPEDRDSFIKWVQTDFLTRIQKMDALKGNEFIHDLKIDSKNDTLFYDKVDFMKLQMDTTNVKANLEQGPFRDAYIYGLKQVYDSKMTDLMHSEVDKQNNIFNVLFWYNLVVNKNNITKNSYAKLLGDVMWQYERKPNVYSRLFLLKGRVGKSTLVDLHLKGKPSDENFYKFSMSGVNFDLMDLFKYYEIGIPKILAPLRPDGGEDDQDWGGEFPENYDEVPDYEGGSQDWGDVDSIVESFEEPLEEYDETEGAPRKKKKRNELSISRQKQRNVPGTKVIITQNKAEQSFTVTTSTLSLPSSGGKKKLFADAIGYNPFKEEEVQLREDQVNSFNYYKLAISNVYDLLNRLGHEIEIEVEVTNEDGSVSIERFDPNKDYKC